jgi:hypothetical protein
MMSDHTPHHAYAENNDSKMNQKSVPSNLCGAKRHRAFTFTESGESNLRPNLASGRLSSIFGDSLQFRSGFSYSPSQQPLSEFSLTSLAGIVSSMKSRGRTISTASEQTTFTCAQIPKLKQKCSKCGHLATNIIETLGDSKSPNFLSPSGKQFLSFQAYPNHLLSLIFHQVSDL